MSASNRRGYTLIELVVTVLIIGILTSIAVPQYLRTVETGKADDAVAMANMIGTTNKMFALDHAGVYVYGAFPTTAGASCGSTCGGPPWVCPTTPSGSGCDLVCCKYLADQDWGDKPYTYDACSGATGGGTCAVGLTAAAARATSGSAATSITPYSTWGYDVGLTGVITALNSAPPPTY